MNEPRAQQARVGEPEVSAALGEQLSDGGGTDVGVLVALYRRQGCELVHRVGTAADPPGAAQVVRREFGALADLLAGRALGRVTERSDGTPP